MVGILELYIYSLGSIDYIFLYNILYLLYCREFKEIDIRKCAQMPVAIFSCDTIKTKWDKSNQAFTLYNKQTLFKQIILSYKICQGIEEKYQYLATKAVSTDYFIMWNIAISTGFNR